MPGADFPRAGEAAAYASLPAQLRAFQDAGLYIGHRLSGIDIKVQYSLENGDAAVEEGPSYAKEQGAGCQDHCPGGYPYNEFPAFSGV